MKKIMLSFLLLVAMAAHAQQKQIDSLKNQLAKARHDTSRLKIMMALGNMYYSSKPDSGIIQEQQALQIAEKLNLEKEKSECFIVLANCYVSAGDYAKGMELYLKAIYLYEKLNNKYGVIGTYNDMGSTYVYKQDYKSALHYLYLANNQLNSYLAATKDTAYKYKRIKSIVLINLGESYLYIKKLDSAGFYLNACYKHARQINYQGIMGTITRDMGELEAAKKNKAAALNYFKQSLAASTAIDDVQTIGIAYLSMANLYRSNNQRDSAEYYAKKALDAASSGKYTQDILNASKALYAYYDEDHNTAEAYKYYRIATTAKDSLYSQNKMKQLMSLDFEEKQHRQAIANAQIQYESKVRTYVLIAGLLILLFIVFVFWRNSLQRKLANTRLQKQKVDLEAALSKLHLAQGQLIQSEKMASLGELTAGIAHEIQNPLNFVNNFSEINIELLDEMEAELDKGDIAEARAIAAGLKANLSKIKYHGKRADGIVKGMLQHSKVSSGVKEQTNISKLTDGYMRLAYYGLKAKNKTFEAELVKDFDASLPLINVVRQDMGRVMLNMFNNAFYAVLQKQKTAPANYKPTIEVSTAINENTIQVRIWDNGNGIPEGIREKIFQPFFTTKPTGEGTGLGLSLSYDIIVKAHGGNISINSKEGEHAEFIISLPITG